MRVENDYQDDKLDTGLLVTVGNLVYVKTPAAAPAARLGL